MSLHNPWSAWEVSPDRLGKKSLTYQVVECLVSLELGLGNFVPSGREQVDFLNVGAWGQTSGVHNQGSRSETGNRNDSVDVS